MARPKKAARVRDAKPCKDHPKYAGLRTPRTACAVCLLYYKTKRAAGVREGLQRDCSYN